MAEPHAPGTALVTGANRGLGYEVVRALAETGATVYLTARDPGKGAEAAETLAGHGLDVRFRPLDVTADDDVARLAGELGEELDRLDVLVNNAGINFDYQQRAGAADLADVRATLETNLFGPWRMVEAFLPLIRRSERGRIVNVSSEAGSSFASPGGMTSVGPVLPAYTTSKVGLNALTVKLAADLADEGILVNAVCPGLIATYPGAEAMGARPVPEGAASVLWAATLPDDGPTGGFFRDGQPLPW